MYAKVKSEAKRKFKVFTSHALVKTYKQRGGKYRKSRRKSKSGLSRWFSEEWIDVCQLPKIVPCGRNNSSSRSYPYCCPRYKVTSKSPRTARSYSRAELRKRYRKKKRNPMVKVR